MLGFEGGEINRSFFVQETNQDESSRSMNRQTFGALDMGGASTQITFVPTTTVPNSVKLTLYGKEYSVYTHSFLCYGLREAQRRFLAQLVKVMLHVGCDLIETMFTIFTKKTEVMTAMCQRFSYLEQEKRNCVNFK